MIRTILLAPLRLLRLIFVDRRSLPWLQLLNAVYGFFYLALDRSESLVWREIGAAQTVFWLFFAINARRTLRREAADSAREALISASLDRDVICKECR